MSMYDEHADWFTAHVPSECDDQFCQICIESRPILNYRQPKRPPLSPSARKAISRAQKLRHAKEKESK